MTVDRATTKTIAKKKLVSTNALVIGGGVAGMQAALDIANQGFKVYLVDRSSSIGGRMAMIDKTFPTLDCSACILTPRLSEVSRHPNIELMTHSEVQEVNGKASDFRVKVLKHARYVDDEKCTGCSDCVGVCPVEIPNRFDSDIGFRKAVYIPFPQATPITHTITKRGHASCRIACPANVNAQAFIAMMREGKYDVALDIIREAIPFAGVLGRVCPAICEEKCERQNIDESISIRNLHRWLADHEQEMGFYVAKPPVIDKEERVAVVGAGPAGIACAERLARLGYPVEVFEKQDEAGGLLRYGIPAHRLPRDIVAREIKMVEDLGVKFNLGVEVKSLSELFSKGFKSVFLGTGAPVSSQLRIAGEDAKGMFHALDFLERVNKDEKVALGPRVAIIGGGNAAIDAARVAKRLGARNVRLYYRRSRAEMPAIKSEIRDAEEEGVELEVLATPVEIITSRGKVIGLKCIRMKLGEPDESGRRRPVPIEGSEFSIPLDSVIVTIGQRVGPEGPHSKLELTNWGTPEIDPITMQTSRKNVFAGGDIVTGGGLVVEAVAAGHNAAESIHRYLRGEDLKKGRPFPWIEIPSEEIPKEGYPVKAKSAMPMLSVSKRSRNFEEVEKGFDKETALLEAGRCISCGICCECNQCVEACKPHAIDHSQVDEVIELDVGAIVVSTGYKLFDVSKYDRFGYNKYANVIQAMEYERLINAAGPAGGHLIRLSDGKTPSNIAFVQCVGARDVSMDVPSCSRVCCMYGIKNSVMAKEHHPEIDVTVFYADIRAFGKGFEEFYEMAKTRFGVGFVRGRVAEIAENPANQNIIVRVEDTESLQFLELEYEMVVLSPGIQPSPGVEELANHMGLELDNDGYIEVEHPILSPVDAAMEGVFVCGCADSPKDIPDSVAAGSAAAMRASIVLNGGAEE